MPQAAAHHSPTAVCKLSERLPSVVNDAHTPCDVQHSSNVSHQLPPMVPTPPLALMSNRHGAKPAPIRTKHSFTGQVPQTCRRMNGFGMQASRTRLGSQQQSNQQSNSMGSRHGSSNDPNYESLPSRHSFSGLDSPLSPSSVGLPYENVRRHAVRHCSAPLVLPSTGSCPSPPLSAVSSRVGALSLDCPRTRRLSQRGGSEALSGSLSSHGSPCPAHPMSSPGSLWGSDAYDSAEVTAEFAQVAAERAHMGSQRKQLDLLGHAIENSEQTCGSSRERQPSRNTLEQEHPPLAAEPSPREREREFQLLMAQFEVDCAAADVEIPHYMPQHDDDRKSSLGPGLALAGPGHPAMGGACAEPGQPNATSPAAAQPNYTAQANWSLMAHIEESMETVLSQLATPRQPDES